MPSSNIVLLSLVLLSHQLECVASQSADLFLPADTDPIREESIICVQKYFDEMSKARLYLIRESSLQQSRSEQIFLWNSNKQFSSVITLTTFAAANDQFENYLIFLTSKDFESLKIATIPVAHENSFLYIFYEQDDSRIRVEDILSIFTPSFDQNIVIMTSSSNPTGHTFRLSAYRIVLHKCWNFKQYRMIEVGQCEGGEKFTRLPMRSTNNAACPLQVAGILNPPFTYHDEAIGFYRGIDYDLIRLISNRLDIPINITFVDFKMGALIQKELLWQNSTVLPKNSKYLGQVEKLKLRSNDE